MKNEKHRLFIGIPLEDPIRDFLNTRVDEIKDQFSSYQVNWQPKEKYHVTLLFLGSVAAEKIMAIKSSLAEIKKDLVPFSIEIGNLILFPNSKHPKIIAAKISLTEPLGKLYALLHQQMSALEIKLDERPYIPHVTLGRIKHGKCNPDTAKRNPGTQLQSNAQLVLFESIQTQKGSSHKILSEE